MRAEVIEQPAAAVGAFAPAIGDKRAETIPARLEGDDGTEQALRQDASYRQEITVPAPVLKHRELALSALGRGNESIGLQRGERQGLVDHDVLAGIERGQRLRTVQMIGRCDDHEIEPRQCQ